MRGSQRRRRNAPRLGSHARASLPTTGTPPAVPSPRRPPRSPGATSPRRMPGTDLGLLRLAAALAVLLLREVAVLAVRHRPQLQGETAASAHRRIQSATPSLSFPASSTGEENPQAHFRQPGSGNRDPRFFGLCQLARPAPAAAATLPDPAASDPLTDHFPPEASAPAADHTTPSWPERSLARTGALASPNARLSGPALRVASWSRHLGSG